MHHSLLETITGLFLVRPTTPEPPSIEGLKILRLLGKGGVGAVYLAEDEILRRQVAVKVLAKEIASDAEARQRFLREARAMAAVEHPHIVNVHSFGEAEGQVYLVMQYVEGETLADRIARQGKLSATDALTVVRQVVDALESAWKMGVVHRDIKPSNILIDTQGNVRVADFGLAQTMDYEDDSTLTHAGAAVGTPHYISPEQAQGQKVDFRSDIYSLGIVLFEMIAGWRPYTGTNPSDLISMHIHEPLPSLGNKGDVHPDVVGLVEWMAAKAPEERPASYAFLAERLEALLGKLPGKTTLVIEATEPIPHAPVWRRAILASALAGALVVLALLAIPTTRGPITNWINPIPLPALKYVAVLPFEAASGDPDHAALALGISEMLTSDLARLTAEHTDLLVAQPSRIDRFGVSSVQEGEEELGTTLVLRGNLEDHDRTYRLQVVLEGADRLRREATVEAPSNDPFVLHARLLETVVGILEVDWTESERRALRQDFETHDRAACSFLLRGQGYLRNREDESSLERAITQFDSALRLEPDCGAAMAGLGLAQWRRAELVGGEAHPDLAIQSCEEALRLDRQLVAGNVCLAEIFVGMDRYEDAVAELERAHHLDPTHDEVLSEAPAALATLGRFSDAESLLLNAIARRPNDWRPRYDLAYLYAVDLGRHSDAATELEEAARLAPRVFRVHSFLGAEYAELMRYEDAARALGTSLEIRENNVDAHNNLATAYFFQRNWSDAAEHYGRAIELAYENPMMWGNLGDARYWSPGEREQAEDAYERALQLAEEREERPDGDMTARMAVWTAMLGRPEEALALSRGAVEMAPQSPSVLMKAARVCDQLGDPASAVDWIEKALTAGYQIEHLLADPTFDDLRDHPEFERIRSSR